MIKSFSSYATVFLSLVGAGLLIFFALALSGKVSLPFALSTGGQGFTAATAYWKTAYANDGTYLSAGGRATGDGTCATTQSLNVVGVGAIDVSLDAYPGFGASGKVYAGQLKSSTLAVGVSPNTQATINYSCRPSYSISYVYNSCSWYECGCYASYSSGSLANSVVVKGPSGEVLYSGSTLYGSVPVTIAGTAGDTKNYTVDCVGGSQTWTATASAVVFPPNIITLTALPATVLTGNASTLSWSADAVTDSSCIISSPAAQLFSAQASADKSPNGFSWTLNNLDWSDFVYDTPTNNFAVGNRFGPSAGTLTSGNLTSTGVQQSTFATSSGKWYWEVTANAAAVVAGVITEGGTASTVSVPSGTTAGFKYDADAGSLTYTTNGSTYNPVGSGFSGKRFAYASGGSNTFNFGQGAQAGLSYSTAAGGAFKYTPPAGFKAFSSRTMTAPAIAKSSNYFDAVTYTGNGGTQSITSLNFQPDLVWLKNTGSTNWHTIADSVRGVFKSLFSNDTSAETTSDSNGFVSAFSTNGFTVTNGALTAGNTNVSAGKYIAWAWKEAPTTDGVDIVSYSGNGAANRNISHALGATPDFALVKRLDAAGDWFAWHSSFSGNSTFVPFNSTVVPSSTNSPWGTGNFSATQFMVSNNATNDANNCTFSQQTVILTSGTTWTVPSNWSSTNTIEVIGGGGGGGGPAANVKGGGGGGGAYAKISNLALTPNATVQISVGAGGAGGAAGATAINGTNGGATWFNGTSLAAASVSADGGKGGLAATTGGAGGLTTAGVGTVEYAGGAGGNGGTKGGGGGGAAGLNGAGRSGSNGSGGQGDADYGGSAGGLPGGDGNEWGTAGSGGGGGAPGGGGAQAGFDGGLYGGGGGGGNNQGAGGSGRPGVIVITYTPSTCQPASYVAYLFKQVDGFSSFGKYTGNASANGPFVYTGFKPKYVMVKNITGAGYSWYVNDSTRNPANPVDSAQALNTAAAQINGYGIDFLTNGFKIRGANANWNAGSAHSYAYAAFAGQPFQQSGQPGSVDLGTSVHFNGTDAYMDRTPTVAGNLRTFTLSFWVKRGKLGVQQYIFSAGTGGRKFAVFFRSDDALEVDLGGNKNDTTTTTNFRDPNGWVHILISEDSTQSTQAGRGLKIYANNVDVSPPLGGGTPNLNEYTDLNSVTLHRIGQDVEGGDYFDGYLADLYLIDGQQLPPSAFAAPTANGYWEPASYNGSYGTNGFHLDFTGGGSSGNVPTGNLTQNTTFVLQCTDLATGSSVFASATVAVASGMLSITATDNLGVVTSSPVVLGTDQSTTIAWTGVGSVQASSCEVKRSDGVSTTTISTGSSGGISVQGPFASGYRSFSIACTDGAGQDLTPAYIRADISDVCSDIPGYQAVPLSSPCLTPGSAPGQCIPSGYIYKGSSNSCINPPPPPVLTQGTSFTANRVRSGAAATLSWIVSGMVANIDCYISPAAFVPTLPATGKLTWVSGNPWSSSVLTSALTSNKTFTLSCGNSIATTTASATATLLPGFREI